MNVYVYELFVRMRESNEIKAIGEKKKNTSINEVLLMKFDHENILPLKSSIHCSPKAESVVHVYLM